MPATKTGSAYKLDKRREKNKIRKLNKYFRKHPNDLMAARRIEELEKELKK